LYELAPLLVGNFYNVNIIKKFEILLIIYVHVYVISDFPMTYTKGQYAYIKQYKHGSFLYKLFLKIST